MIQLKSISYDCDNKIIFTHINETLPAHQKIGIVGKNGCGKTTLFKLIRGELNTLKGDILYPKKWRISHLDQSLPDSTLDILTYVIQGDEVLKRIHDELLQAELDEDYEKMIILHGELADIDGYNAETRAAKILHGLGFSTDDYQKPVSEFSGGWQMRVKLARILLSRADLLLLDEPTNHLDLNCILWLESWLRNYKGMVLIISHDRDFLDNTVNYILYIHAQTAKLYSGNYSTFESQRALELQTQQKSFEKQQSKITHLMSYVERFRAKANKAKQAQSRLKAIEKMPKMAAVQQEMDISFSIPEPECASGTLLSLTKAEFGYPNHKFERTNFSLYAGQRIGLLGVNGAGKSTLVKALVGELALSYGQRLCAPKLQIGYFSQDSHKQLKLDENAVEHMQRLAPNVQLLQLRAYLGSFGFSQDQALLPLGQCSGGEKARLILAMLIWKKPALLILDEPTNHLDLAMRNALSLALQEYTGGLVLISHDRYMLTSCVNEFWLVADRQLKQFDGDLDDYAALTSE